MPRPFRQQIVGTEAPAARQQAVVTAPAASPVSTFAAPEDGDLKALMQGLGSIHAPLARMQEEKSREAQRDYIVEMQAAARGAPDPATAEGAEIAAGHIPPAYRHDAMEAYRAGIGERLGINAKNDYLDTYAQESKKEGFNFDAFSQEFRAKHLTGLTDPHLALGAAKHIDEAISIARGDFRVQQSKRAAEDNLSTLGTELSDLNPYASPEVNAVRAHNAITGYKDRGGTRAEGAKVLLGHIVAMSDAKGGLPDAFEVFNEVDSTTGKTLVQMNPGLADEVARAKIQAQTLLDRKLMDESLEQRQIVRASLEKRLMGGEFDTLSEDALRESLAPYQGKHGVFNTEGEYASFVHRVYERQAKVQLDGFHNAQIAAGKAASLTHATQREKLAAAAQPSLEVIFSGINDPKAQNDVSAALNRIVAYTARGGFDVGLPAVKQLVDSLKKDIPDDKSQVPPKFAALARFYRDLRASGNSKLSAEYFDEDTRNIMESYLRDTVEGRVDSNTAYRRAYDYINPEARKRAEAMMKDADTAKKVKSSAREAVVSWWRRAMPFGKSFGVDSDTSLLERRALEEGERFAMHNPWADKDQITEHVERWTAENHFRDSTTGALIELPQEHNSPKTQEAISEWMDMVGKAWSKGDTKVTPMLQHKAGGIYALSLRTNGLSTMYHSDVDVRDILAVKNVRENITGAEVDVLKDIYPKLTKGTLTPAEAAQHATVIHKAIDTKVLSGEMGRKAWNLRQQGLVTTPAPVLEKAMEGAETRFKVSPSVGLRDLDRHSVTVAQQMLERGDFAGALTTMSERVRLVAYKDPARGMNIGIGYNMTANAKTIAEDFRKAGIPAEHLEAVKNGQRSITIDQAVRLYDAVRPRYEAIAKAGFEKQFPDEWKKLPANARAVLTDMAYQVGSVNSFTQGLSRLKDGDFSGAGLQTAFLDRHSNQRRIDERRHALRVEMLKSAAAYQTILAHAAKQPDPIAERLSRVNVAAQQ